MSLRDYFIGGVRRSVRSTARHGQAAHATVKMLSGDTIAAISSATGPAARMILRLSGPEAIPIARRFWTPRVISDARATPNNLAQSQDDNSRGAAHGHMTLRGMNVPAWLYVFHSPRSYTGEDSVEFHIPGNPLLAKMLLEDLLAAGARAAEPGEFTARAYFNGRLDLTEAEGVAATIAAGNEQELSAARRLMSGELARRLAPAIDTLANTLALLEVGIDFTDEDVTFLPSAELARRIEEVDAMLRELLDQSARFERLTHEPTVVLVGRPNAGKSTLLNALAGHDRAVVSPVAGTTRDILSAEVALPRGMIRLMDVAGLEQETSGERAENEQHRIDRKMREQALRALEEADCVVLVKDANDVRPRLLLSRQVDLMISSKGDLVPSPSYSGERVRVRGYSGEQRNSTNRPSLQPSPLSTGEREQDLATVLISAVTGEGMDVLRQSLDRLCFGEGSATSSLALNARHVRAIEEARAALSQAMAQVHAGPEFVASELREALNALGRVSGQISPDDLLGRIFSAFCIGK